MSSLIPKNRRGYSQKYKGPFNAISSVFGIFGFFWRQFQNWFRKNRCPKCGAKKCLQYHSEVVTDKVVGHSRERFGRYRDWYARSNDDPFIREWVEERYICKNCGKHVSIYVTRDR